MNHTAHTIDTPFGRFAATVLVDPEETTNSYRVMYEPIGELEELPKRYGYTDHKALEAEAERLNPDMDWGYLTPVISFTVNRKQYSGSFGVEYLDASPHHRIEGRYARISHYAGLREELTDNAQRKLSDWFVENEHLITEEMKLESKREALHRLAETIQRDIAEKDAELIKLREKHARVLDQLRNAR